MTFFYKTPPVAAFETFYLHVLIMKHKQTFQSSFFQKTKNDETSNNNKLLIFCCGYRYDITLFIIVPNIPYLQPSVLLSFILELFRIFVFRKTYKIPKKKQIFGQQTANSCEFWFKDTLKAYFCQLHTFFQGTTLSRFFHLF